MKPDVPATAVALCLFVFGNAACKLDETTGRRDASTGAGGGGSGSGGSSSTGGSVGAGGSGGSVGAGGGGGSTGTGGAGTGGFDGGTGGRGGTGGTGGAGGSVGTGGSGGRADGGGARDLGGGSADSGGPMGALCTAGDCRAIVDTFDGFLYSHPCGDGGTGYDCLGSMCSGGSSTRTQTFTMKGNPATTYEVTFKVRGIVEAKNYSGGMRRAMGMDPSNTGGDQWYAGGTAPNSTYNTYELHVTPKVPGAPNDYFLNARDGSGEDHSSWALNYMATIKVQGGGTITFRSFDANCRQIMNCGPGGGSNMCRAPRTLDLTASVPPPPAAFVQPPKNAQNATGQWIFIDVTDVKAL